MPKPTIVPRHRVAASITNEQDWEQPEPNSGLARMFVIMLLVHVFVIGGIIIYDFTGGDTTRVTTVAEKKLAPPPPNPILKERVRFIR